ncbi:hypothetical protein GobsT_12330 [Gemmata obscuriglobus]|uniref:hypothetical protein n=1 Tax=Gemmata obscuriglobus TaxID=114 RepID=UPI000309EB30|nr:hypothetical protein [Gemmata obscuriglobus]QEG26493.1 hypothetical protein GobsT_12330 [Gemmata obscuriglobus]VTS01767.1 unnamed protein product [Gemmata obscuriglobus UQM 2246]
MAEPLLIRAVITAKDDSSGRWRYGWKEQGTDLGTGGDLDPLGYRRGTTSVNPAVELNDREVAPGTVVWLRERGFVAGQMWYEFAVTAGATSSTTTTTTTTAGPCAGACQWTYSAASKAWTRTTSTCAAGCHCLAPTWCPAADACATTACGRLAADAPAPSCTGATTTPGACGTTTPGACAAGCVWYCHPVRGWVQRSNGCSGACPCPRPAGPCTVSECATEATTPCQVPPYYCTGSCRWMWVSAELGWEWVTGSCSSYGVSGCACDRPAAPGSRCGQEVSTPCYSPQGNNPCQTVTTAGPPTACGGDCLWGSTDGASWNQIVRPCVGAGCVCDRPLYAPAGTCSQAAGACVQGVPTTTTAAPPTTTTAGPLQWWCYDCTENPSYGFWGCAATPTMPAGCVQKSGPYLGDSAACVAACQPPTTTTAGPTTTPAPATTSTTTTTAGPPPVTTTAPTTTPAPTTTTAGPVVDYFCCQCPLGVNTCSFDPINQCAGCTVTGPMSLALCNGTCVGGIGGTTTTPPPAPVTTGTGTGGPTASPD